MEEFLGNIVIPVLAQSAKTENVMKNNILVEINFAICFNEISNIQNKLVNSVRILDFTNT